MNDGSLQDAQIFKERCENSPGVVILCQGDWRPTPERVQFFEKHDYYVLTAANGFQDIVDWLPHRRCIGGMFAHPETVAQARTAFPEKVIERFEGVGARFLRSLTQETPYNLHNAGLPFTGTVPRELKTLDIVSVFSPVPLKRGLLLLKTLLSTKLTAYLFAQSFGADPQMLAELSEVLKEQGMQVDYFHYPFDPYALIRVDGRIVIDGRPIGANNSIVSAYLARARLFVHPSTTEGISNSVMEALLNDVPVLICDDIRGPLQALSRQLPKCIFRSPPDKEALAYAIRTILTNPHADGSITHSFRSIIDPFEINRTVVLSVQKWFARNNLPWKGHCLGLLGGVQSKLDFAKISAEESYRGQRHIYPDITGAINCIAFQHGVASALGSNESVRSLQSEHQLISRHFLPDDSCTFRSSFTDSEEALNDFVRQIADVQTFRNILLIGDLPTSAMEVLFKHLEMNPSHPRLHCINASRRKHEEMSLRTLGKAFTSCHYASSVPLEEFPQESEIVSFYQQTPDKLGDYPLGEILRWRQENISEMSEHNQISDKGIESILQGIPAAHFDAVIINGREFTGPAELRHLLGAQVIMLGCTRTFKNRNNLLSLLQNPDYDLIFSARNVGNGYAGFVSSTLLPYGNKI